jgi:hypothetical protein
MMSLREAAAAVEGSKEAQELRLAHGAVYPPAGRGPWRGTPETVRRAAEAARALLKLRAARQILRAQRRADRREADRAAQLHAAQEPLWAAKAALREEREDQAEAEAFLYEGSRWRGCESVWPPSEKARRDDEAKIASLEAEVRRHLPASEKAEARYQEARRRSGVTGGCNCGLGLVRLAAGVASWTL